MIEQLQTLGCLPPIDVDLSNEHDANLIRPLTDAWTEWRRVAPRNRRSRAARIESWLRAMSDQSAVMSFGGADRVSSFGREWLAQRLLFWPRGVPVGTLNGIAASRLGNDPAVRRPAFELLRRIVVGESDQSVHFVAVENSPLCDGVVRCCELFNRPLVRVSADRPRSADRKWLDYLIDESQPGFLSPEVWPVFVSDAVQEPEPDSLEDVADRDLTLASLSDRLCIVSLRKNGNWDRIARVLLTDADWQAGNLRVFVDGRRPATDTVAELHGLGAVLWHLQAGDQSQNVQSGRQSTGRTSSADLTRTLKTLDSDDSWLIHWTRRANSTWPGESVEQLLDALLFGLPEADHSALASLVRIVTEMRLRGTNAAQRDQRESVSFSAVPLRKLVDERTFRPHRQRWDFEHTGIAIRRELLERNGARPVIYGDDATWNDLPEGERLWFQKRFTETSNGQIDWSAEDEWRFPGDVDLSGLGPDDGFLFCPDEESAAVLAQVSRWPVITADELPGG